MSKAVSSTLFAKQALLADGWASNVRLYWDDDGLLLEVLSDTSPRKSDQQVEILVPGMANLHCHSFQRAMAGLAEISHSQTDSFWSWRDLMYRFVERLTPKDVQGITAFAYMQMLLSGFTSVGEFHYLHHQSCGTSYDDKAEMANRVIAGAGQSGIDLTLLPVFYAHSDFGGAAPEARQSRFLHDVDGFLSLVQQITDQNQDIIIGIAPHSLRAVTAVELRDLLAANTLGPIHIHVAEQKAEVRACEDYFGAPPVRYLLDSFGLNEQWCLIHATHMQANETIDLAKSGAIAGLCPVTEANLGDGIFDGVSFLNAGGKFGIGSDSCVRIDLTEELRLLEYGQRLRDHQRALMAPTHVSVGGHLFKQAAIGGAKALQQNSGMIAVGKNASFVSLDASQPSICGRTKDAILDGWIFACEQPAVEHVWVSGKLVVQNGFHNKYDEITDAYTSLLRELLW